MNYSTNKQYNNLLNKLPEDTELHPLNKDFIDEEYLNNNYNYILFEYTTDWLPTIASLKSNNIEYTIKKDSFDLEYILIK
tara:strand:- start:326 stop:565 length:240 start_codon:yes stop_codon:yes gene_type:complete